MQGVFGEDDEIHRSHVAPRLADHVDDALRLPREVVLGDDDGQLELHEADDDAVRGFVESAQSVHHTCSYFTMLSSPGMSRVERVALDVAIMMTSVRM